MGETKRKKRGRKPKTPIPSTTQTLDPITATLDDDDSAAVNSPISNSNHNDRRQPGRPGKRQKGTAEKAAPLMKRDLVSAVVPVQSEEDEAVARVVPAMDAVVKVFCVHTEPNFSLPWQRKRQYSSSGSGFVIGGRRVLTNAHCVEHFTQVKLKKRGSDTKYLATVLAIGTECDIGIEIA